MILIRIVFCFLILGSNLISQNLGEITIYNTDNSNITYNQVNCLEFDQFGDLWIGTEYGISLFNEAANTWYNFYADNPESGLSSNSIQTIESNGDEIWIGTNAGITLVDDSAGWTPYFEWENIPDNTIRTIFADENKIWVGTTGGLCIYNGETWQIENTETGFYSNNITSIKKNPNTALIGIGTMNGGLVTYDDDFNIYYSSNSDIIDNTVLDIAFDQNNNIIMCTPQAGLGVLTENGSWIWFNTVNSTLPTNSLTNVLVDSNNNLWIATLEDGLVYYLNNNFYTYNIENSNLPDNKINCLTFGPNNNLWLGTETNGLVKIAAGFSENTEHPTQTPNIHPTIFESIININLKTDSRIQIFNQRGKLINNYQLSAGNKTINTEKYSSGLYLIIVESNNYHSVNKLIKF